MVISTTNLDVANQALVLLGQEPLVTFESSTKNGRTVRAFFESARVGVLEDGAWSFSTKRQVLSPLTTAPAFGWEYEFALPTGFLKAQRVKNASGANEDHEIEDGKLLADTNVIHLKYTFNQEDFSKYSAKFIECFAYKLAAKCAYDITKSRSEEQTLFSAYSQLLVETMSNDDKGDGEPKVVYTSQWLANT